MKFIVLFIVIGYLCSCASNSTYIVTAPPEAEVKRLGLDPFYKKYCSANGFPIVGSEKVSDYAFKEAAYLIDTMLQDRPDIRQMLIDNKVRLLILGINEFTTDMPEYKDFARSKLGKSWWDKRARGLGGQPHRPATSCGEENLLSYDGDPYSTENILIHEFAHTIHQCGMNFLDKTFDSRLEEIYQKAMKKGLWKGKYATQNRMEYFAEGVQSWFNNNRENDNDHNHVNTRKELQEYDPDLAQIVESVFGPRDWTYTKIFERLEQPHLKGYNPNNSPSFKWPNHLREQKVSR